MNPISHLKKFVKSDIEGHVFIGLPETLIQTVIVKSILGEDFGKLFEKAKNEKNSFQSEVIKGKEYTVIFADEDDFITYEGVVDCVKLSSEQGERVIVFGDMVGDTIIGNLLLSCGASWYGGVAPWKHFNLALHHYRSTMPGIGVMQAKLG